MPPRTLKKLPSKRPQVKSVSSSAKRASVGAASSSAPYANPVPENNPDDSDSCSSSNDISSASQATVQLSCRKPFDAEPSPSTPALLSPSTPCSTSSAAAARSQHADGPILKSTACRRLDNPPPPSVSALDALSTTYGNTSICKHNLSVLCTGVLQQLWKHPNSEAFRETIIVPPEELDRYFETISNPACLKRVRFPFIFSFVIIALTFLQLMNTTHTRVRLPFLLFVLFCFVSFRFVSFRFVLFCCAQCAYTSYSC
jgi:hypothetical protein